MKAAELREMSPDELKHKLRENKDKLMNARFQQKTGQLSNPLFKRHLKREIARILTIIAEKNRS